MQHAAFRAQELNPARLAALYRRHFDMSKVAITLSPNRRRSGATVLRPTQMMRTSLPAA